MSEEDVLRFIEDNGVVLESASGPVPSLAATIAGEPVGGSWWDHPRAREIYRATRVARSSGNVLVCRLVEGMVTYVHRRLWPALVRLAGRFPPRRLAQIVESHTSSGRHEVEETAFPAWVPESVTKEARTLSEEDALSGLGSWLEATEWRREGS